MPTPPSTSPRLSRQKSGSAADCRTWRPVSTRQRWVAEAEQATVTTSVPLSKYASRTSRQRPLDAFTTWAKVPPGGAGAGAGLGVGRGPAGGLLDRRGVGLGERRERAEGEGD